MDTAAGSSSGSGGNPVPTTIGTAADPPQQPTMEVDKQPTMEADKQPKTAVEKKGKRLSPVLRHGSILRELRMRRAKLSKLSVSIALRNLRLIQKFMALLL